jgi:hypothetical protein
MNQTNSHCISSSYYSFLSLAIDLILNPQVLSDVTPADANGEGREWHPKTKYVSDILKKNDMTKLVGDGRKWNHKTEFVSDILKKHDKPTKLVGDGRKHYHKTGLIADILKENDKPTKTKLISDGYEQYLSTNEGPCYEQAEKFFDCLGEGVASNCAACIVSVMEAAVAIQMTCTDMMEVGFCDEMYNCWENDCNASCDDEMISVVACDMHYGGCDDYEFHAECTTPEL